MDKWEEDDQDKNVVSDLKSRTLRGILGNEKKKEKMKGNYSILSNLCSEPPFEYQSKKTLEEEEATGTSNSDTINYSVFDQTSGELKFTRNSQSITPELSLEQHLPKMNFVTTKKNGKRKHTTPNSRPTTKLPREDRRLIELKKKYLHCRGHKSQ